MGGRAELCSNPESRRKVMTHTYKPFIFCRLTCGQGIIAGALPCSPDCALVRHLSRPLSHTAAMMEVTCEVSSVLARLPAYSDCRCSRRATIRPLVPARPYR